VSQRAWRALFDLVFFTQGSNTADELIGFGEKQDWQKPLIEYAYSYAKQVKKDYHSFLREYKKGYFS